MLLISKSNRLYMALAITRDTVIYLLPEILFWVRFLQEPVGDFLTPVLPAQYSLSHWCCLWVSSLPHPLCWPFFVLWWHMLPEWLHLLPWYSYHLHMGNSQTSISCYNTRMVFVMTCCTFTTMSFKSPQLSKCWNLLYHTSLPTPPLGDITKT